MGCIQEWLHDPDGQEATPWGGWASSAFLKLRSVFLWGILDEKCKDLKLSLNNGLKNMSLSILDHQKSHKYAIPQHSSLFIHFGAFGFFFFLKHWY